METSTEKIRELRIEFDALMRAPNTPEGSIRRKQIIAEIATIKRERNEIEKKGGWR